MTAPRRARPASPSSDPVAAASAVSLSRAARSHPVIPVSGEPETPQPHLLRLAGLAALFGLGRRRSAPAASALPDDDPYAAYLRWASSGAAPAPAEDGQETAAA